MYSAGSLYSTAEDLLKWDTALYAGKVLPLKSLEELLASLDQTTFWRAHRSYLVNINRIREVVPWFKSSYQLRMDDKKQTEIPVSRAQTKRLRELFGL